MATQKVNIDNLIDSYLEQSEEDNGILDEMLTDEGYNPEELSKRGIQRVKQLLFQQQVAAKKAGLLKLYNRAVTLVHQSTSEVKETLLALLRQKSPSLQFRSLEKLDEENLQQILSETEILDLIDKMEKGQIQ